MDEDLTFEMLVPETLLNWRRRALAAEARAQHMDELVGVAKEALSTLERASYEPFRNGITDQNGQGDEGEYWYGCTLDALRTILAKIEGSKT